MFTQTLNSLYLSQVLAASLVFGCFVEKVEGGRTRRSDSTGFPLPPLHEGLRADGELLFFEMRTYIFCGFHFFLSLCFCGKLHVT